MKITRRAALQTLAAPALLNAAPARATAFALIGDRYHNSDYIRTGLAKTLVKDAGVSVDFTDDVTQLTAESLTGRKLLILFRDGMIWPDGYPDESANASFASRAGSLKIENVPPIPPHPTQAVYWMTAAQGKAVKDFVAAGGGLLCYHNVTYISPRNEDFREVFGAVTKGHPPLRRFKVKVLNSEHPVTKGITDFVVTDEQHYMEYQKDPKNILLQAVNEDGLTHQNLGASAPAGWAHDYGKGRVCYFSLGHLLSDLWNPEFEKLQKNAAKWLLKES